VDDKIEDTIRWLILALVVAIDFGAIALTVAPLPRPPALTVVASER